MFANQTNRGPFNFPFGRLKIRTGWQSIVAVSLSILTLRCLDCFAIKAAQHS
jgi:hypothetical protein